MKTAPMDIALAMLICSAKARPFNHQVIHARNLFSPQLRICSFTEEDILREREEPLSYNAQRDHDFIADHIQACED